MKNSRKAFAIIVPLTIAAVAAVQFSSCEKFILPELYLSPDTLSFSALKDSSVMNVASNVSWSRVDVAEEDTWITLSPEEGSGNCEVKVVVEENSSSSARTATVSISSEIIKKSILVIQQGSGE